MKLKRPLIAAAVFFAAGEAMGQTAGQDSSATAAGAEPEDEAAALAEPMNELDGAGAAAAPGLRGAAAASPPVPRAWAHATNSRKRLKRALGRSAAGESVAVEADVLLGHHKAPGGGKEGGGLGGRRPVMAHPPSRVSDLSFVDFLSGVRGRVPVKLDFKDRSVVTVALEAMEALDFAADHNMPLWLNADVLPGPGADVVAAKAAEEGRTLVDADEFIEQCT